MAFPGGGHIWQLPSAFILLGSVVFSGGIDILMSENICHKINIAAFLIKSSTIGTP